MKCQLLCLLFVAIVATCFGMVFNCVDLNNCDQCPPMPGNCKKIAKCGCCDICEDFLKLGESCVMSIVMAALSQKNCGPELMCDQETMKCAPLSVVMTKLVGENGVISPQRSSVPESVGCNGSVCFCAHEFRRLDEYDLLKQEHINANSCNCAFAKETYRKTKLIGKMFFCNKQGGYEKMQCRGSVCFCVNEAGESLPTTESFHISEVSSRTC